MSLYYRPINKFVWNLYADYVTFPVPPTSFLADSAFASVLRDHGLMTILIFSFFLSCDYWILPQYSQLIFWGLDIKKPCMKKHRGPRYSQLGCCVKPYAWTEVFLTCTMECMVGERINHFLLSIWHFEIRWLDETPALAPVTRHVRASPIWTPW